MAAYPKPRIVAFKAGGTIVKGHAVKIGADAKHVIECTASTDPGIGIAAGAAASGDPVEVYMPGGGAEGKAHGTITAGDLVGSYSDGTLQTAASGDRVLGTALDGAVAGDLFPLYSGLSKLP